MSLDCRRAWSRCAQLTPALTLSPTLTLTLMPTQTPPLQARVEEMVAADGLPAHLRPVDPDEDVEASASAWTTQLEPPASLIAPMLPYQKEGLGWLCSQEASAVRGGILAGEPACQGRKRGRILAHGGVRVGGARVIRVAGRMWLVVWAGVNPQGRESEERVRVQDGAQPLP